MKVRYYYWFVSKIKRTRSYVTVYFQHESHNFLLLEFIREIRNISYVESSRLLKFLFVCIGTHYILLVMFVCFLFQLFFFCNLNPFGQLKLITICIIRLVLITTVTVNNTLYLHKQFTQFIIYNSLVHFQCDRSSTHSQPMLPI